MNKKVLITGSSGTLGKILVNKFDGDGVPVVGIDIRNNVNPLLNGCFKFHNSTITDRKKLTEIFKKEKPSHVIHLACSYNTIRNRQLEYENDIIGSENVVMACNETPSVKQFVYFSSGAAYGGNEENDPWLKEEQVLRPGKYRYGLNKKMIEEKILNANLRPDLQKVILRACTVVGPGYDKDASVVSILIKLPFMLEMCRDNMVQFLHEEDMLNLVNEVIDDRSISGIFNLASDTAVKVRNLIPEKKYIHIPYPVLHGIFTCLWNLKLLNLQPAGLRYGLYPVVLDPSKLVERYNYRFSYTSKEAFELTREKNMLDPRKRI